MKRKSADLIACGDVHNGRCPSRCGCAALLQGLCLCLSWRECACGNDFAPVAFKSGRCRTGEADEQFSPEWCFDDELVFITTGMRELHFGMGKGSVVVATESGDKQGRGAIAVVLHQVEIAVFAGGDGKTKRCACGKSGGGVEQAHLELEIHRKPQ